MRDRGILRRLTGAVAAALVVGVLAAPAVIAQDDETEPDLWAGSEITSPSASLTTSSFQVRGRFVREGTGAAIASVEIDFGRLDGDVYDSGDSDSCVPEDPGPVPDAGTGNGPGTYEFEVPVDGGDLEWPCNGRYLVRARATAMDLDGDEANDDHLITRIVEVAVAPPAVYGVAATAEGEVVTVSWTPIDDPSEQAVGYRIERAGPKSGDSFGHFIAVGDDIGPDADSAQDHPQVSGDYRYRVRALRRGVGEPIPSPADGAEADVSVTVASTTTTSEPSDGGPAIPGTRGRPGPRTPRSSGSPSIPKPSATTPTTIDTGFENELDYGDRALDEADEDEEPGELADGGEGQAIIRTEGDGAGLAVPTAGALVLLGWAGHVVYLNRLAKQF